MNHSKQNEVLRNIENDNEAAGAEVCTNADIQALMEIAGGSCASNITTLASFKSSANAQSCLMTATNTMIASPKLISKMIAALVPKEADDPTSIEGFATLKDFMEDCIEADGICKEKHEIVCAVDLLGRSYLTSDASNKQDILNNWHKLMRESYLGRQFSAWQNDVNIRREWLESAVVPDFLKVSVLENNNKSMLQKWEDEVFSAHHNVLAKQFTQTSLEVLTRVENNDALISARDQILSEFADG